MRYAEEDMARLRVVDRGMMVGDVVAAESAPSARSGEKKQDTKGGKRIPGA